MRVIVDVKGLDKLRAAFQRSPEIVQAEFVPAMRQSVELVRMGAVPWTPIRTGMLVMNYEGTVEVEGNEIVGQQSNPVFYGYFHEVGTRRGVRARHMMERGLKAARPGIEQEFEEAAGRVVARMAR
jgi:hypothetical protein